MLIFWLSYILYLYLETYLIAPHDKEVGLFRQKQPEWFLHDWWFWEEVDLPNHRGNLLLRCCNKTLEWKRVGEKKFSNILQLGMYA